MNLHKLATLFVLCCMGLGAFAQNVLTAHDLFKLDQVVETALSPDGKHLAYILNHDRPFAEGKGLDYRELHVMNLETETTRAYLTGKNYLSSLTWTPDGSRITFLANLESRTMQLYAMYLDGGAPYQVTNLPASVSKYDWHPTKNQVALISYRRTVSIDRELRSMGFDAEVYEEGLTERNLYLYDIDAVTLTQLNQEGAVYELAWNPQGTMIAAQIAPFNLVDDSYMFKKINLIDPVARTQKQLIDNPGKLTAMKWSPDGEHIAFVSAVDISDPVSGSLFVVSADNEKSFTDLRNYSKGFEGSVSQVAWKNNETVVFSATESVDVSLSEIKLKSKRRKVLLEGGKAIFTGSLSKSGDMLSFIANHIDHPYEAYTFDLGSNQLTRRTHHNKWLADKKMGKQVKISYKARDGLRIDGVLIYPVGYEEGTRYPMVTYVHGGPESAEHNGWQTAYSK